VSIFGPRVAKGGVSAVRDALVIEFLFRAVDKGPFHVIERTSEDGYTQNRILGRRLAMTFGQ